MPYDLNKDENKPVLPDGWRGSTHLNSTIKSYEDVAYRVKAQLGFPVSTLEVSDEQIAIFIDEAIEMYTQWGAAVEEKYLVFRDTLYEEGCGVKLDNLINETSIKSECIVTLSSEKIIGYDFEYAPIESENGIVFSAYLSASPFQFPSSNNPTISALGQELILKFDKSNPWDSFKICKADCFTVFPTGSNCESLSSKFDNIDFSDLIYENPSLSSLLENPIISSDGDGIIPVSSLDCDILNQIPFSYFSTSAFYPNRELVGFPVKACISIKEGQGIIFPSCSDPIDKCIDLSANWEIDPDFDWTYINSNSISGEDGRVLSLEELDLSTANSVIIPGIPSCSIDGSITLNENNGRYSTFFLCNSALDTGGNWEISNVQFAKTYLPPEKVLYTKYCDVQNKGFTIHKTLTAYDDCIQNTPDWVKVDVVFETVESTPVTAMIPETTYSGFDSSLNSRRKIHSVFSMDYTVGSGGHFGANLLFSFDYGVVANAFGYDLQGNRNLYRNGYDMLSYHMARGFIDQVQLMVNYASFDFNPDTQYLKITPEPWPGINNRAYVVGVRVEKPIEHIINKKWVHEWVRARTMETLGFIRSKYGNVTLYGGASIQGESLVSMGQTEMERLLRELRDDHYYTNPPLFFIG